MLREQRREDRRDGEVAPRRQPGEDERLAETGIAGAVNASGIVVDAGAERKPVQEIRGGRIANEVRVDLPLFGGAWVRVAGGFEKGANGRRANVEFDSLEFFDETSGKRVFRAAWPFKLVKQFRPASCGRDDFREMSAGKTMLPSCLVGSGRR